MERGREGGREERAGGWVSNGHVKGRSEGG